jgi:glyoxylase I family protein
VITTIHHVAVGVTDMEAGLAFYRDALGAELLWRSSLDGKRPDADRIVGIDGIVADIAMLRLGGVHIELWTYHSPAPVDRSSPANGLGYPHFALLVEDIDSEHARLTSAGMTFVGPPVDLGNSSAVYGTDPFGNLIELYEIRSPRD